MDDSAITCDEIIDVEAKSNNKAKLNEEETKSVLTNFNEKNITCKMQNSIFFLRFY